MNGTEIFHTLGASRIALGAPISSAAPVPAVMDDIQILKGAQHSPAIVTGVPVSNSNDVQNYAQNAPVNNNNNNNNSMQMQAPTPQQMAMHVIIHEPRTDWQSGLFECFNDINVCASRPAAAHSKQLAPALPPSTPKGFCCAHVIAPTLPSVQVSAFLSAPVVLTECSSTCTRKTRCQDTQDSVCASPLLSASPLLRVAGGRSHALRQLQRVLHGE